MVQVWKYAKIQYRICMKGSIMAQEVQVLCLNSNKIKLALWHWKETRNSEWNSFSSKKLEFMILNKKICSYLLQLWIIQKWDNCIPRLEKKRDFLIPINHFHYRHYWFNVWTMIYISPSWWPSIFFFFGGGGGSKSFGNKSCKMCHMTLFVFHFLAIS